MSGRSIDELIDGLQRTDRADVRRAAADTLKRMERTATPAIAPLIGAAIDIDGTVREVASKALMAIDPDWPITQKLKRPFLIWCRH